MKNTLHSPSKRRLLLSASAAAALALSGCASQSLDAYVNEKPVLDLHQYFNGPLKAYGIFTDRSGTVVKRFSVTRACLTSRSPTPTAARKNASGT